MIILLGDDGRKMSKSLTIDVAPQLLDELGAARRQYDEDARSAKLPDVKSAADAFAWFWNERRRRELAHRLADLHRDVFSQIDPCNRILGDVIWDARCYWTDKAGEAERQAEHWHREMERRIAAEGWTLRTERTEVTA